MFSHDKENPREPSPVKSYREAYTQAYRLAARRPVSDPHLRGFVESKSKPLSYMPANSYWKAVLEARRGFVDGYFMGVLSKRG
jgi:hypothetical protein